MTMVGEGPACLDGRPIKILHVNHLLDPVEGGGTAERTFQLSREIALQGNPCTILTLDIGYASARADGVANLQVVALPCLNQRFFVPKASQEHINKLVATHDIVQMFGNWTVLNAMVWRACRHQRKPFIFCPAGALPAFGRSQLLKKLYTRFVSRGIVRDAARGVCITQDECAHFINLGADAGRLVTIPNGIDPDQYHAPQPGEGVPGLQGAFGDAPFIFFLGRLNPIKGPDLLLDAFLAICAKWPQYHLVFGGPEGGMLHDLQERAASNQLADRVHFIGFVNGTTKASALNTAELLVIPSRSEAMSIVVLEAGACGCPVLYTDACGLEEFERRGAGMAVPADTHAIADALDRLLSDPALRKAQAERLQELVMSEFLWRDQASRYISLYGEILKGTRPMLQSDRSKRT